MTTDGAGTYRDVAPPEAEALVRDGRVRVLDVRSPREYQELGHIPGAVLLPVDLIAAGAASLAAAGPDWLVVCEHGVRSAHAAQYLQRAGFEGIMNLTGGMSCWQGPRLHEPARPEEVPGPAPWLLVNADLLPWGGRALDVACGDGRNALLLAQAGFSVEAVDRDAGALARLAEMGRRLELPLRVRSLDLEAVAVDLGAEIYDLVVVIHFLHRPLFAALRRSLKPGGLLLYETFTRQQAERGRPRRPEFLLQDGELLQLVAGMEIVRQRQGEHEGRMVAGVAALKGVGE